VTIVVPHGNSREKNAAMRAFGAELLEIGRDFDMAREAAERLAVERGLEMVPSFHPDLVKGVATYALEFFRGAPDLDTVYVPIGMGSGIAGLIRTRDLLGLATRIVGVVSTQAPAFALSFKSSKVVTTPTADTFADGVACRTPMADAVRIVCAGAERIVSVSEEEIAEAMRAYFVDTHNAAEGAGAAALAALMQEGDRMRGKRVGLILSGGNIDMPMFAGIVAGGSVRQARAAAAG
jgi:threonine dehydratase